MISIGTVTVLLAKQRGRTTSAAQVAAKQHLTSVLMRFVWMSYSRATAFLICFLLARTSVMKTCTADF